MTVNYIQSCLTSGCAPRLAPIIPDPPPAMSLEPPLYPEGTGPLSAREGPSKTVFRRLWKPNGAKTLLATPSEEPKSSARLLGRLQATVSNLRSSSTVLRLSLLPSDTPALRSARTERQTKAKSRLVRNKVHHSFHGRPAALADITRLSTDTATIAPLEQASAALGTADTKDDRLPSLAASSDQDRPSSPVRRPRTLTGRSNTVGNMIEGPSPRTSASTNRSRLTSDDDDNVYCVSPSNRRRPQRRSTPSFTARKSSPGASDSGTEDSGGEGPSQSGRSIPLRPRVFVKDGKDKRMKRQKSFHIGGHAPDKPRKTFFLRESRFQYEGEAYELFRKSARKVYMIIQWTMVLSRKDPKIENQLKSFMDIAQDLEDSTAMDHIQKESGLSFDPGYYKAKKDIQLNNELKFILTLTPDSRTPDMIQKVLHSLSTLQAFVEYPPHMQAKFARVAWYQKINAKRTILKQGHMAENFYFILNGTAMVKKIVNNPEDVSMRAVARLQKGQSFGEIALLRNTQRTASVESITPMEVLVIGREDFHRIFFNAKDGEEPEHIKFCRKYIDFLHLFPLEKCVTTPGTCVYHYFRPGAVVVGDSNKDTDWIYIVKSGGCQVLKKLKSVLPQRMQSTKPQDQELHLPKIAEPSPKVDTNLRRKPTPGELLPMTATSSQKLSEYLSIKINVPHEHQVRIPSQLMELIEQEEEAAKVADEGLVDDMRRCEGMQPLALFHEDPVEVREYIDADEIAVSSSDCSDDDLPPGATASTGRRGSILMDPSQRLGARASKTVHFEPPPSRGTTARQRASIAVPSCEKNPIAGEGPVSARLPLRRGSEASNTGAANITSKLRVQMEESAPGEEGDGTVPCYVQLRRLRPKEAFGLEDLAFDDDKAVDTPKTSVTLVSNGAELIMLSRRFFIKHASDLTRQKVREKMRPYPNEETLQENLQCEVNWNMYRKDVVLDLVTLQQDAKDLLPGLHQ